MNADSPIYVAGHRGLVGSAIHRKLDELGFHRIITIVATNDQRNTWQPQTHTCF